MLRVTKYAITFSLESESGFYMFKKIIYDLYFVYVVEALITSKYKKIGINTHVYLVVCC